MKNILQNKKFIYFLLSLTVFFAFYSWDYIQENKYYEEAYKVNADRNVVDNLDILSFATDPKHHIHRTMMLNSEYPITVLNKGKKFNNLRDKFHAVKEYIIKKNLESSKRILMFVDGYDVLFTPGRQNIIEKFNRFEKPLVFSAENNCYPDRTPVCMNDEKYPKSPTEFRYVNSGTYIGEAWAVFKMVSESLEMSDDHNDQLLAHLFFIDNQDIVDLDYSHEIFSVLYQTNFEDYEYNEDRECLKSLITGTCPVALHGNGGYKKLLMELYKEYFPKPNLN